MTGEAEALVRDLDLAAHPEGGFYREMFRSPLTVTDPSGRTRSALTVIYYLLPSESRSAWHRLASDETWHFARGSALEIAVLASSGIVAVTGLGPQGPYVATIPAKHPFAARVPGDGTYALVTCCVAPGFDFADFELLEKERLCTEFPRAAETVRAFSL